jgi:hypothetical protein
VSAGTVPAETGEPQMDPLIQRDHVDELVLDPFRSSILRATCEGCEIDIQ